MNTFMNNLKNASNYAVTENGALAHKTTKSAVYDMFALGGAYRKRSDEDCILLFKKALKENETLALKCLFYLRDCRGGQGERRFFRVCYKWLANNYPKCARRNIELISEYGRWDDLLYSLIDTPIEKDAFDIINKQFLLDLDCKTPSLLAKWMPSENASSKETKRIANLLRSYFGLTHREYRKSLSLLREKINVLERLMSANRWDEIKFDKIPSKAGLIYKNAFARRDIIAKRYETFATSKETTVNASTLYPYDVVFKAVNNSNHYGYCLDPLSETDKAMIEKYWNNLPDYFEGKPCKMMCVVDTSTSMIRRGPSAPINVAISLGMYCAERIGGPFKNHYISFSREPQLIEIEGVDFVDKVRRIYMTNLCSNTDLVETFRMLKEIALTADPEDVPETLVVISDMQIDRGSYLSESMVITKMELMRKDWETSGLKMPRLVYWNVEARGKANFLDDGPNVTYVSGCSPVIFKSVLTGKTGYDLMIEVLTSERYRDVI